MRRLIYLLMAVYSATLLLTEWNTSQEFVRNYFTDIRGPVYLYAANTSLSFVLLAVAAALSAFSCWVVCAGEGVTRRRVFDGSQAVMFAGLALDDRFLIHEAVGSRLPFDDAILLGLAGLVELGLLWRCWPVVPRGAARAFIVLAGGCFGVMLVIDAFAPLEARLRLSCEDLTKVWGALFVTLFCWELARVRHRDSLAAGSVPPTMLDASGLPLTSKPESRRA